MLCSIDDFFLADGTLAGGYALTDLKLDMHRIFDVVIPIGEVSPVLYDRDKRRVEISFKVQRVHDSIKDSENYINVHEATIPRTGDIELIVSNYGSPTPGTVGLIVNGALLSHQLVREIGSFTEHEYRIVGSPIFAPTPGDSFLITESGDRITTEASEELLVEES